MKIAIDKEKFLEQFRQMFGSAEWVVSSSPFSCEEGYSKVYVRRKRVGKHDSLVKWSFKLSECVPNEEVARLKEEWRERLNKEKRR